MEAQRPPEAVAASEARCRVFFCAHMGVVVLGLFSLTSEGEIGGIYLMFAHGLVSPGLFIAVTCLYDRYNTRLIRYYWGI